MRRVLLALIRWYQRYLSPVKGTKCPYIPSCSAYGAEAIARHGALKGSILALWRIVRCNPFSRGGYDPVPEQFSLVSSYWKEQIRNGYRFNAVSGKDPRAHRKAPGAADEWHLLCAGRHRDS